RAAELGDCLPRPELPEVRAQPMAVGGRRALLHVPRLYRGLPPARWATYHRPVSAPPVLRARSGRRSPGRWSPLLVTFGLLGAACSGSSGPSATTTPPTTAGPPTSSPGTPALVASLPSGCAQAVPAAGATVTFVAQGRGWAVAPDGSGLTCLFEVSDPGPFQWGPRSDRVVLGGLEVRGVGSTASRAVGSTDPAEVSWGRPSGKAVVFVDTAGKELEKALVGATTIETVTPA